MADVAVKCPYCIDYWLYDACIKAWRKCECWHQRQIEAAVAAGVNRREAEHRQEAERRAYMP